MDKSIISKRLKEYRKKIGYTQEEISERLGIAEKHYGKLERGEFLPSLETFFRLIEELKIPISEFGFDCPDDKNELRQKLLKEVFLASDDQLKLYLDLIDCVKNYPRK